MGQRRITIDELEANCVQLLDEVADRRETLVVVRDGKTVARIEPGEPRDLIGSVTYNMTDDELVNWSAEWKDDRELTRAEDDG